MAGPTSPGCVPPDRRRQRPCGGQRRRGASGALVVFDVLHLDARAARELPYRERRAMLQELVREHARRCLAPASTERFDDVIGVTRAHGLEGVGDRPSALEYRATAVRTRSISARPTPAANCRFAGAV